MDLELERRADGTILMRSREPLAPHDPILPRVVAAQARALGDRPYLLERRKPAGEWVAQSYAETRRASDAIAQWLIDQRVPADRPVLILSGNSIAHATLKFGAWAAGVPVCPVSANYGLMGPDFGRLKHVVALTRPGVVFVEDAAPFAAALSTVDFGDAIVLTRAPAASPRPAYAYDDVLATPVTPAVERRIAALDPDQHAAYMLTSGSTGKPKAVIQTFRMIGANITQATQTLGRAAGWDGAMLDWLPWSHVSGVSGALNALVCGGTLYIDGGRPMPGMFEETLRNIRDVQGRYFVNVPIGYAMLADALEADGTLREAFFRNLHVMLFGGAGLPQPVYDRLQRMAIEMTGRRIFLTTGYGATETTSGCMSIYWDTDRVGIGLPLPGTLVKLVPADGRYEIRVAGPIRMPGYLNQPEKNVGIFDEEGYYRLGDLVQFHDPEDPAQGLYFAGRLAEEFKLGTGTWIAGGHLRAELLKALAPLVSELVVCGDGQTYVAILAWPDPVGVAREFGIKAASPAELAAHPALAAIIRERIAAHNLANPGASTRVGRCLLLAERPDPNAHEMSDKGTVNRSAILERRASSVEELYAQPARSRVIVVE